MSGVGGAHFKGNIVETERKYTRIRELQLAGKFLKEACLEVGMSMVYYRRLMKRKGHEAIAGQGDRAKSIWGGDELETGNTLSPGESKAVFEHAQAHDPLWDSTNRHLGGPGLPPMHLGPIGRSRTKKIFSKRRPSEAPSTIQTRRSDPDGGTLPGRSARELE